LNARIQKINSEIQKTKDKIGEFQAKVRDLEKQKTELENMDIINAVRGSDISLADLAAVLKKKRGTSGQSDPKSHTPINETNKEENEQ